MLLKQADKLVKEGNYAAALEAITKARELDPKNPYARAYEERVRTLLKASQSASAKKGAGEPATPAALSPSLEQISTLAIQAEQRGAQVAAAQKRDPRPSDKKVKEEEERRRKEDQRRAAILSKVGLLLDRAKEFGEKNEYTLALEEISRAYLLDPTNPAIRDVEQKIRTSQEESSKRQEVERQEKTKQEERAREEQLRNALARVQREQEEKRMKEEEARSVAQKQKLVQHVQRCREFLSANRLQEAQSELAFIVVIDPLSQEVDALGREIREKQEQQQREELERARKQEEENRKRLEAIQTTILKHVEDATRLADGGEFAEALREITRAYVLDPFSETLQACENKVIAAQDEARRHAGEQLRAQEEARRAKREEDIQDQERVERERLLQGESAENEAKRKADREQIAQHLAEAQRHVDEQRFESALAEVALAFLIDPFDEDVKQFEQYVLLAQGESSQAEPEPEQPAEDETINQIKEAIATHLAAAQKLRESRAYGKALDEVAKAFTLDPLDEEVQRIEDEIHAESKTYQEDQKALKEAEERKTSVHLLVLAAREYVVRGAYEEAQTEVEKGFKLDPESAELKSLMKQITDAREEEKKAQAKQAEAKSKPVRETGVAQYIQRAKERIAAKAYDEALAEIALAVTVDPSSQEALALEAEVWKAKEKGSAKANGAPAADARTSESDRLLKIHLMAAEEFAKLGDTARALDEIAKAYVIDPTHKEIKKLEDRIRQQQLREQNEKLQPLKLVYRKDQAADGSR